MLLLVQQSSFFMPSMNNQCSNAESEEAHEDNETTQRASPVSNHLKTAMMGLSSRRLLKHRMLLSVLSAKKTKKHRSTRSRQWMDSSPQQQIHLIQYGMAMLHPMNTQKTLTKTTVGL